MTASIINKTIKSIVAASAALIMAASVPLTAGLQTVSIRSSSGLDRR